MPAPYRTPKAPAVQRLHEDRQWNELSSLIQQGLIAEESVNKVASLWVKKITSKVH